MEAETTPLEKSVRRLILLSIGLYLVVALIGAGLGGLTLKTYSDSDKARSALCALRADLQKRVLSSQDFLNQHPRGAFGFSPEQIQKSIRDQKSTIHALSNIDC